MGQCDRWFDGSEQARRNTVDAMNAQCDAAYAGASEQCNKWEDQGHSECTRTRDDGYSACAQQEDQGHEQCCDWIPCSWLCDAFVWVSNWVCVGWTWVSHVVCEATIWISKMVCIAPVVVTHAACKGAIALADGAWWLGNALGRAACGFVETLINIPQQWDHICGNSGPRSVSAVPRVHAVTFNVATVPSRFSHRDTGQRQEFRIVDGKVSFSRDGGASWEFVAEEAVSYEERRRGVRTRAPRFDMVAADNGRVIAKEEGVDRFYVAMVDEMFWQYADPKNPTEGIDDPEEARRRELRVPSTYFKLDPEQFAEGAVAADLLVAPPPCAQFNGHPDAERFDFFRGILGVRDFLGGLVSFMVVAMEPRLWHRIDTRPPRDGGLIPKGVPARPAVVYCNVLGQKTVQCSIAFDEVLDIGMGHANWYEQYNISYGGEIQPLQGEATLLGFPAGHLLSTYQAFNGPVQDYDGFVDGTANYYVLCRLSSGADGSALGSCEHAAGTTSPQHFALLFLDEQSFFSQRWRLAHPDDHEKLLFALVPDLHAGKYEFDAKKFWCPFKAGFITDRSRLAVSRQVVLVNGEDPAGGREIYSINFSWATADYTWRWRHFHFAAEYSPDNGWSGKSSVLKARYLPDGDRARGSETIGPDPGFPNCVYPQTVRIRGDATIHLKGTCKIGSEIVIGRWFQKYLPADCSHMPTKEQIAESERREFPEKPPTGYSHPWQFLPEDAFQRADTFSHFGVYEDVDSRSQYYRVELDESSLPPETDERTRWEDGARQLVITCRKFDWSLTGIAAAIPELILKDPIALLMGRMETFNSPAAPFIAEHQFQSLYTPGFVFLTLAKRKEGKWIARHWDKRDDDLIAFDGIPRTMDGVPKTVLLSNAGCSVSMNLGERVPITSVPAVQQVVVTVYMRGARVDHAMVSFQSRTAGGAPDSTLWKVKSAALPAGGGVKRLFEREIPDSIQERTPGSFWFDLKWMPRDAREAQDIETFFSESGRMAHATSVWFEDIVGHVSAPDMLGFEKKMLVS